jgi:hypothetical protein
MKVKGTLKLYGVVLLGGETKGWFEWNSVLFRFFIKSFKQLGLVEQWKLLRA